MVAVVTLDPATYSSWQCRQAAASNLWSCMDVSGKVGALEDARREEKAGENPCPAE